MLRTQCPKSSGKLSKNNILLHIDDSNFANAFKNLCFIKDDFYISADNLNLKYQHFKETWQIVDSCL